jgi:hypothetical protein
MSDLITGAQALVRGCVAAILAALIVLVGGAPALVSSMARMAQWSRGCATSAAA